MTSEDRLDRLEAKAEIRSLKAKYCQYVDRLDHERWTSLFTEDATMGGGLPHQGSHQGHEELAARLAAIDDENRQFMSHTATDPRIEVDGDEAAGRWSLDVLAVFEDGTLSWMRGSYEEEYRRVEGDWKFASIDVIIECRVEYADGDWSVTVTGAGPDW